VQIPHFFLAACAPRILGRDIDFLGKGRILSELPELSQPNWDKYMVALGLATVQPEPIFFADSSAPGWPLQPGLPPSQSLLAHVPECCDRWTQQ
jgi:hypothetical protein